MDPEFKLKSPESIEDRKNYGIFKNYGKKIYYYLLF